MFNTITGSFGRTVAVAVLLAIVPRSRAEAPRVAAAWSVCVYCGASDLPAAKFAAAAGQVGEGLARRKWTLVYGGSKTGLMGAVARGAKNAGGRVVGVLPEFIRAWEVAYDQADELVTVTTMHERKNFLQARADAFVILPGGSGTLDELADTLELRQLDLLKKPVILLNQDGYYDGLLAFVDRAIAEKFSRENLRQNLSVVRTVDELFALLEQWETPRRGSAPKP
jgi:uncharacterized protein (TIGR00730 family)